MLIEKLRRGVLHVESDTGVHTVEAGFLERIRLLWTFRNFQVLPQEVLSHRERQLIGMLCSESRRHAAMQPAVDDCVIGTIDCAAAHLPAPLRKSPEPRQGAALVSRSNGASRA